LTHLLDTNSCINHLRLGQASNVTTKLASAAPGTIVLCSIVVAELLYGAHRSARKMQTLIEVRNFCSQFQSLAFDDPAAEQYGELRAYLDGVGTPIGPNDLMIASTALVNSLILVTHNTSEFRRVPSLKLEDWQ
jgi:tRNA(fMet)-specific endonuclease VapC